MLFLLQATLFAFPPAQKKGAQPRQKGTLIHLLHSDELYYNQRLNRDAQILVGHVRFRHDDVILTCDSALYYKHSNSFDAFGNVHMNQGDTLTLVSDVLFYDGTDQLARARYNVILTHNQMRLYCDSLDYDRLYELGYFFNGGRLVDGDNTLESEWGQYSPPTHEAVFNYNVDMRTPKSTLVSDTLHYNTETGWARIVGPSNVDNGDNHIYSENGSYDTRGERVYLLDRSIVSNKGISIEADSLYYQSDSTLSKGYGNVIYIDRDNRNELRGNYLLYSDSLGYAEAADSAMCVDYSQRDTFYIHADTFKLFTYYFDLDSLQAVQAHQDSLLAAKRKKQSPDSLSLALMSDSLRATLPDSLRASFPDSLHASLPDSLRASSPDSLFASHTPFATDSVAATPAPAPVDSTWREVLAYNHVRAYRRDIQAVCDSMVFISKDSCMTMYKDPILWQEGQQLLGEEIKAWVNDSTIDSTHVIRQALSVERVDTMCYNQVTGALMRSFFVKGQMDRTIVEGNVLVNYFPFDEDSLMIGMVHAEGTLLQLFMGKKSVDQIKFIGQVDGSMHPLALIQPNIRYLENFQWFDYVRPVSKEDIFHWRPKKEGTELKITVTHSAPKPKLPSRKPK
jgi:lipopolysaccharide export system protein LptA